MMRPTVSRSEMPSNFACEQVDPPERNTASMMGAVSHYMVYCPVYEHVGRGYDLSEVMAGTVKALSPWPELASQMSEVYAEKLEQVKSAGAAGTMLQCDVYYALIVQRKGSAALP
jgi:hypothetical protein